MSSLATTALGVAAVAKEARRLHDAWCRSCALRQRGPPSAAPPAHEHAPAPAAKQRAWVTLLTNAQSLAEVGYARGVAALWSSLQEVETEYPLIVMVTAGVAQEVRADLIRRGCEVRPVEPLDLPEGVGGRPDYACAHFAECWAKLRMWEWEEFEQLCYLDADMLCLRNMDELLEDELLEEPIAPRPQPEEAAAAPPPPPDAAPSTARRRPAAATAPTAALAAACRVRAVQECFCPVAERRHLCAYAAAPGPPPWRYFNAGLLVLRPCRALLGHMRAALARSDLAAFTFAEQDFLNVFFGGAWEPLPWIYNASKALYAHHRAGVWDLGQAKNLHYTMAKPWDLRSPFNRGFEQLNMLWYAAFTEPHTLCRVLLKVHLAEKRERKKAAG